MPYDDILMKVGFCSECIHNLPADGCRRKKKAVLLHNQAWAVDTLSWFPCYRPARFDGEGGEE